MRLSTRTLWFTIAVTAAAAFVVSTFTVLAEPRLRPGGSFRVVVTGGIPPVTLPHLATFMPDGGVVGSVIPVSCLEPGVSMSESHGAWTVRMSRGVPTLHFNMVADLYRQSTPNGDEVTSDGEVSVVGSAPLTFGAIKGTATLTFPPSNEACVARYNGKMDWTATEIEAMPQAK